MKDDVLGALPLSYICMIELSMLFVIGVFLKIELTDLIRLALWCRW